MLTAVVAIVNSSRTHDMTQTRLTVGESGPSNRGLRIYRIPVRMLAA